MLEEEFLLAFKSTVDRLGYDLAQSQSPPVKFVDLDNTVKTKELFDSEDDGLVWEMLSLEESPIDPLYTATFNIGARTVNDPANYDILALAGKVKAVLKSGVSIDIHNYSGAEAGPKGGYLIPTSISVNPQQYERVSGIRMLTVVAKTQRM